MSDRYNDNNPLTIGHTGHSAQAIGEAGMSWTFKTTHSAAVNVCRPPSFTSLHITSEWMAAIVCPDIAFQSSLMPPLPKRLGSRTEDVLFPLQYMKRKGGNNNVIFFIISLQLTVPAAQRCGWQANFDGHELHTLNK